MSIFDKDIHLPIEHLYDACRDIVDHVIPMNMMHYNGQCETMQRDIMFELKNLDLLTNRFKPVARNSSDVGKINKVDVKYGEFIRGIPTYIVEFFYVEEIFSDEWFGGSAIRYEAPFARFTAGINGVIHESVQQ